MDPAQQELLLNAIARGDQQAFAQLVHIYSQPIFGIAMAYAKSREGAEEVVQDVFLKVWDNRLQLPKLDNFEGWLFIVARNRVLNAMRDRLASSQTISIEADYGIDSDTPYVSTETRDQYRLLLKGIDMLPEKRREVFKLSRLEGLTHKQIAAKLGIHEVTVAQYIVKALASLRQYLKDHGTDSIALIILLRGLEAV